jgi:hypothetical protein
VKQIGSGFAKLFFIVITNRLQVKHKFELLEIKFAPTPWIFLIYIELDRKIYLLLLKLQFIDIKHVAFLRKFYKIDMKDASWFNFGPTPGPRGHLICMDLIRKNTFETLKLRNYNAKTSLC